MCSRLRFLIMLNGHKATVYIPHFAIIGNFMPSCIVYIFLLND